MSPLKSFAIRSSATRAAKQAGYTLDQIGIGETNGRFYWFVKEATEVSEESTEADIGYGDKLEEDERMEPDSTDIQIAQVEAAVALGKKMAVTEPADRMALAKEFTKTFAPIGAQVEGDVHSYYCPHCGISLENGVGAHGDDVNRQTVKHEKYEFACLGCGGEFGPEISVEVKKATTTKAGAKKEHSTAERPCKKVWFIADDMITANPEVKRKEILEACAKAGIAFYTARTQYHQWLGVRKEMAEREAAAAAK